MRTYLARLLVEHTFSPQRPHYSSFSELVVLCQAKWSMDYSTILFDDREDLLAILLKDFGSVFNGSYQTADDHTLTMTVREIAKLTDLPDGLTLEQEMVELDERLYTFGEVLSFDDFREQYYFGLFSD